jgi:hypothetical protein
VIEIINNFVFRTFLAVLRFPHFSVFSATILLQSKKVCQLRPPATSQAQDHLNPHRLHEIASIMPLAI